ncbi:MAG TPA: DNA methyltransferase, partial [Prosthecobacter sp.]|nr:DNA methyltransferase [Prosthecobacter sp.]
MSNRLYYGDNLNILREHIADESVDLIYLDPPFNSKRDYNLLFKTPKGHESDAQITAFEDTWHWGPEAEREFREIVKGANTDVAEMMQALRKFLGENDMMAYLTMMANRLLEMRRVLKQTGALYLHCDPTASHYLKIVLDGVFGFGGFRNEIIWKRTSSHGNVSRGYGDVTDSILYFTKSDKFTWNQVYVPYSDEHIAKKFTFVESDGRRYTTSDLRNPGVRPNLHYPYKARNGVTYHPHPNGWAVSKEKMAEYDRRGLLYFPKEPEGRLRLKRYLDEAPGERVQNLWHDISPINSQAQERLGFPTQKPLALLERIIQASTNENDIVLDPFCGCGTAVHAAQKLRRQWIGIDITHLAVSLIEKRLKKAFPYLEPVTPGTKKAAQIAANSFEVIGVPRDFDAARDLATRDPHLFQLWACTLVGAQPYRGGKRGADKGIDGLIFPEVGGKTEKIIVSVKAGENIGAAMVRDLRGTMEREKAAIGLFITLTNPTRDMVKEAAAAGFYEPPRKFGDRTFPRLQILTVAGLLAERERA